LFVNLQLTLKVVAQFYKDNKAAVDSIAGFEQFSSLDRRAKIATLCSVHRNRPYRPDINFKLADTPAMTGAESDGDEDNAGGGASASAMDQST
jgi:hypothetical protein